MDIASIISNPEDFLAHISEKKNVGDETLKQHSELVLNYTNLFVENNDLEIVINDLLRDSFKIPLSEKVFGLVKELFFESIYFHDLGKVNPNFQVKKMRNVNFKGTSLSFSSNHSFPGYYIFLRYSFSKADELKLDEADEIIYIVFSILFGIQIAKHHDSKLDAVCEYLDRKFDFESDEYLEFENDFNNGIKSVIIDEIEEFNIKSLEKVKEFIKDSFENEIKPGFSLFAFLKLHYSLLTASDYLATMHYMNQWKEPLTDFGKVNKRLKEKIILNVRTRKDYNKKVYDELEGFEFKYPTKQSNVNLNRIRQELSVDVIQNIRKNPNELIYYIEAPTGGGKTNLSMIALAELLEVNDVKNIYYVFPFTTLITQTYKSLIDTMGLDEDEIVQLHSKSGYTEKSDDDYGKDKKNHIDSLFVNFPIALMSHVKFFNVLKTNRKEDNYLLHRLANSVVIIDELQSYPPKVWDKLIFYIENYARYFNIRFILMSATLPKIGDLGHCKEEVCYLIKNKEKIFQNPNFSNRVEFDYSLLEWAQPDKDNKGEYLDNLAKVVLDKSIEYSGHNDKYPDSVFTIIEFIFKQTATQFYSKIDELANGFFDEIFVLSGTILEPRRKEIIEYLKNTENRDKKIILITTQVVEAGVDIDMDLGFKDKSLIDSDEQLAGRINRNVNKPACKLYLFKCDSADVIYGGDERYRIMNKELPELHKEILMSKDFDKLYNKVMLSIDDKTKATMRKGFDSHLELIENLDYPEIDKDFMIINQISTSVFIPMDLPVIVPNSKERNFSKEDISFLKEYGLAEHSDKVISGVRVYELYEKLIKNDNEDFIDKKTNLKKLQGIMSQFIISLMTHSKSMNNLILNASGEELMGMYYLTHYKEDDVYDYKFGLIEKDTSAIIF